MNPSERSELKVEPKTKLEALLKRKRETEIQRQNYPFFLERKVYLAPNDYRISSLMCDAAKFTFNADGPN